MAENRDRYGTGGDPSIAPRGNGYGSGNGNGGRGYNGRTPPNLGFDGEESSVSGRGRNDERFSSRPPNTPMTPYTPYTPVTMGYDGEESSISAATPRHDRYYGEESAVGGRPAVTSGTAGYYGGEGSFNAGAQRLGRHDGPESYVEGRPPRTGRYEPAESTISVDTPRTSRFDPGMESSIAHPDTPRTAHYDTTATTMSMDPSRVGPYDKDNTITVAEYHDPEQARERERQMMEREKFERERGMRQPTGMDYLSTSGSSTSSYLDISRHITKRLGFKSFFSTPSEKSDSKRKKEKKKKSNKLMKHNSSSSSSLNEDLAFGTGFLRYRRKRNVRSRDGKDRQWETIGYKSSKENLRDNRSATHSRPTSARRPTTDAEILAVGAGLAKLARDQNKKDVKNGKNGRGVPDTAISSSRGDDRGLPPSRIIPYETNHNDDDGWESASDDESDSSVNAGLAFGGGNHGGKSQVGFFGRKKTHRSKSRKSSVVDPRLLGPCNSLNGFLSDRPVGFEEVQWESGSDFGQQSYTPYSHPDRHVDDVYAHERDRVGRAQSVGSGSQASLQQVFPVPTNDPSRFDVARASSSEYNTPRPAPVPIQQPQPITPVSQSVYHEPNYVRSESGGILKSSSGRSKSLAGAALAGVAGAAVGAAFASSRRNEKENVRDDGRGDNRSYSESAISRRDDDRKEKRGDEDHYSIADSSISKPRDDERKERPRDYDQSSIADSNLTWDEKREKRREERRKDDTRSSTSNSDRDKIRERSMDDPDAAAEERERRRRERREERRAPDPIEDNYEERKAHVLSEISAAARTPTDPFQYQIADTPPREESSSHQPKESSVPTVVTVEREPDFTRKRSSSIKEPSSVSRTEPRPNVSDRDDREQRHRDNVKALHDAEMIYEETEHSTAPIEAAAIAAAAAVARETLRESRSSKRRGERRIDTEDLSKGIDTDKVPEKSHEDVMAEADRAYREIVMARKVAAEVRRSRTPSPERSVMNKYEEEEEEVTPRIITPPGMHERKKGPYDAPNADFKLDYIMTPKDLKVYSIPSRRYKVDQSDLKGPFMTKDADARLPRPILNLVLPTPVSTPSPEKQFATVAKNGNGKTDSFNRSEDRPEERHRSEPEPEPERYSKPRDIDEGREQTTARSQNKPTESSERNQGREGAPCYRSVDEPRDATQAREQTPSYRSEDATRDQDRRKRDIKDMPPIVIGPRGDLVRSSDVSVPSPTQSTVSKAVTWGPNETKHFEVESPTDQRDEYISDSSPETPEKPRYSEPRSESQSEPKTTSGWAAMAAGIVGAGVGAAVTGSIDSPKRPEVSELARILKAREMEKEPESPRRPEVSELARILKAREREKESESPRRPEVSELARILKAKEKERDDRLSYEYRGVYVEPESPYGPARQESLPREMRRDSLPRDVVVEPEIPRRESRRESPPRDTRRESFPQATVGESPPNIGPKPTLQSSHMPGSFDDDLDFTATVAAGLQDTGFNPDLVIENPAFRKRDSPPGSNEYAYKAPWAESIDDVSSIPGEHSSNSGFVMGEVPETPKDWSSISPDNEESPKLSEKEHEKRDKERRRSGGDVSSAISDVIVEEPESYFDSSMQSRKEQKKHDKDEARRQSLLREESSFVDIESNREIVEEPESYIEPVDTPKQSQKSFRSYDDNELDTSVSTLKRKSSKRSSTYDGKFESPLRGENYRSYSLHDIKNGDESKIPRKAKRDSEHYDSPDPSQISLPDSENSHEDHDLSRELEKPTRRGGDDPLWASSRSILSAGSSSKLDEEDSPQKHRKSRSSTKNDNDGTKPITSEPTRDENEDSKKKAKESTPKKSSGLFGFFSGAKADAAKEELAKGNRDDPDDVKKKKKKRSSASDGITGSQPFSDGLTQMASGETNGHKSRSEDNVRDSRNDGEKKRSKSSDSTKKSSFLDNAGILGAGAGLAAGAIAISAQHQQQYAANNNDSEGSSGERREQEREEEILDPEIIERQIRPSIDPQYGDLLPLPPSGSVSPNFEPIVDLPKLPESRPVTPESEKRTVGTPREKTPRNRKSLQETPVKSPSQSAVPLKFVMGNRSNPSSPIITRSTSNTPFPAFQPSPIAEPAIIPRSRSRPMSWDNTKEFQPLYLLETNRRGSFVPEELIEPLPHLPPSRTNSELDVADLPESGLLKRLDLHRPSLDPLSTNLPSDNIVSGESTPTAITFKRDLAPSVEFLRDSFPSVKEKLNLSSDVHSHEQSPPGSVAQAVGAAAIATATATATAASLAIASHDTSNEQEPRSFQQVRDKSGNDNLEYFAESHDIAAEREKTLQTLSGISNKQAMSIEEEVESTEEFPLSKSKKNKKGKGLTFGSDDITDQAENTPNPIPELESVSTPIEAEHVEPVDKVTIPKSKKKKGKKGRATSWKPEPESEIQTEIPGQENTQELKSDLVSSEQHNVTESGRDIVDNVATPAEVALVEPSTPKYKEDRITDNNDPPVESELETETLDNVEPLEPMDESPSGDRLVEQQQVPESSQQIVDEPLLSSGIDHVEESSIPKSKNDRKKEKERAKATASEQEELISEPMVESPVELPLRERSLEESPELSRETSEPSSSMVNPETQMFNDSSVPETPGDITPAVDEFTSPKSKRDRKKAKKAKPIALNPEPKQVVIERALEVPDVPQTPEPIKDTPLEMTQNPVREGVQEPTTPANVEPIEELSTLKSKKNKKDKESTNQEQTMNSEPESVDPSQEKEQVHEPQEKDLVETPTLEAAPKLDNFTEAITSPSSKKSEKRSEKGKVADIKESAEPPIASPIPESISEKPTPMVGPGGWPITPATPWTAGAREASELKDEDYFPAAETILPTVTAGAALLDYEELKSDDIFQDKNGSDGLATDLSKSTAREGLSDNPLESQDVVTENTPTDLEQAQSLDEPEQIPASEPQYEDKSIPIDAEVPGGLDGHKQDQLEPTKQMEQGSELGIVKVKKNKKGKKRAKQNQDDEFPSKVTTSDNVTKDLNEQTNIPTSQSETIESLTNKASIEEPKEITQKGEEQQAFDERATVDNVISEPAPMEEVPTIMQEPETIENIHVDPVISEPGTTEKTLIDPIVVAPEPEVLTPSKKSKKQKKRDSLLASNYSEQTMTPEILDETKTVDVPEQSEPESKQFSQEPYIVDSEAEFATFDKKQDKAIKPTSLEDASLPKTVNEAKTEEVKSEEVKPADIHQEISITPFEPSTVGPEIKFQTPPKKFKKDKMKRGKQAQSFIEDDTVPKGTIPAGNLSNIETPIERPSTAPVEQTITVPAKEPALHDTPHTPMTAGLSGLMGPLTERKKGVLEMVQALGWGKKKDKATIAAAEQGLPPRPSTARAVSESSMPKVIEAEPITTPTPTTELEKWAFTDENPKETSTKGKSIATVNPELVPSTIVEEEPLPIEPEEDAAQQSVEAPLTKSIEDVQGNQSPKRLKGKKGHSLQSFLSEEASRVFRAKESAIKGPETPSLRAEPGSVEQSHDLTSGLGIDTPVEEKNESESVSVSVSDFPTKKSKKDTNKRQSLQSLAPEETPKEEGNLLREASKPKASEIYESFVERSQEPLDTTRESVLEDIQALEVPFKDAPEPIVERSGEPEVLYHEVAQNDIPASQPHSEQAHEPTVEKTSEPSEFSQAVDQEHVSMPEPLSEGVPEPILERSSTPNKSPREIIQEDTSAPQTSFEHVPKPSVISDEPSLTVEPALEEIAKDAQVSKSNMLDEPSLSKETIPDDIMASVEYVEPTTNLQESYQSREPLSEELGQNDEVFKPSAVDGLPLPTQAIPEEDRRGAEIVEPSHSGEESFLPRESLDKTSKDADESLSRKATPQEESRNLESFKPSQNVEETLSPTGPAGNVERAESIPSEISIIQETEPRDETALPSTKKSKKNKKSMKDKDKSQPELEVPNGVTKEPEQTFVADEPISKKPLESRKSFNRENVEQPVEKPVETTELENRDFLEPASVPLPEDHVDERIELNEPANAEFLEPFFERSTSIPILEELAVNPEIEKSKNYENLDYFEHAASIPLPDDTVEESTEHSEPEKRELAEDSGQASEPMEQTFVRPSDNEIPTTSQTLEFPEPVSPTSEKSVREPAPVSPKRSRKDKKKRRKSATPMLISEEPLPSEPLPETKSKFIEPISEKMPQIPNISIASPSNEPILNEPQASEVIPTEQSPEADQRAIEPTEIIATPSNSQAIDAISQENFIEPSGEIQTKKSKKDKKERKSQASMPLAEDITSQAPLEHSTSQHIDDILPRASAQGSMQAAPETKETTNESIVDPTLKNVEVEKDDTPKSGLDTSLENQEGIESVSGDITQSPETNFTDVPAKKSKKDKKKRKSIVPSLTDETRQPVGQSPAEEFHGEIAPEETTRDIGPEPVIVQERKFERDLAEEGPKISGEPVLDPTMTEPPTDFSKEPTIGSENAQEDVLIPQDFIVPQESPIKSRINENEPTPSTQPIIEPEPVSEEVILPHESTIEPSINDKWPAKSREPITQSEVTKGEASAPEESIVESTKSQPQIDTPRDPFIEPEMTKEQGFLPQEPTIESRINEEQPASQQEPETTLNLSDPGAILKQESVIESILKDEQLPVKKPVIEVNNFEPEQIALPESPIELKPFEPEFQLPQESVIEPEIIEQAPIYHKQAFDAQSSDLALAIPSESSLEQTAFEPEQIKLPESPIGQAVSELEMPLQEGSVPESHSVEVPMLSQVRSIEPENLLFQPAFPSKLSLGHGIAEPEQIALPESPMEHESFEPEVLFRQEPITESKEAPVDVTLPSPESRTSQEVPLEGNVNGKNVLISQDPVESEMTEESLIPHQHDASLKSELESIVPQELPIELISQLTEVNVEEPPVLERKMTEEVPTPQETSVEPNILEPETVIPVAVLEDPKNDFIEPISPKKSKKDKKKRKKDLELLEHSEEPTNVASTSRAPEIETPAIVSESTSFGSIAEPTPSPQPIVSEVIEPFANVGPTTTTDFVGPTLNTEPITHEKAASLAFGAEPLISDTIESVHEETIADNLPVDNEPAPKDEWAWPAEDPKENDKKSEDFFMSIEEPSDLTPQTEGFEKVPHSNTEPPSMENDVKEPLEEAFLDAVESFPVEDISTDITSQPPQPIETADPEFEKITQESAEKSLSEVFGPIHEQQVVTTPIPETVQQQTEGAVPSSEEITLGGYKLPPVDELPKVDLPREMLIKEHPKEEHRPAEDDVTEVLTKNSKDIKDREFGFSSPVQFIPKNTPLGVPDAMEPISTEITLDEFKAMPTGEMPKEVQQQTEDEWGSIPGKKSKEDKKRSSLSTPLEPEVLNVATELPEDIPLNTGKPEELPPTIDNDVPDTHTSFQIPQVETIVRGDDHFSMSHDEQGQDIPSRALDPHSQIPVVPNTVAVTETEDVKPGERLFISPIPMRDTVQKFEPITEPETILSTASSSAKRITDESENLSSDLSRTDSKKDKRKRQATINLDTPKDDRRTFWAGEVPEAEVIRDAPVIEDIGRDEFYSHIARTVEEPQTNEFSRPPAKKGKKNSKTVSVNTEDFGSTMREDLPAIEPMKERKEMPSVVAATAVVASAAFLAGKSKELEVEPDKDEETSPMKKLSDKERNGHSMEIRAPSDDIDDDPVSRKDKDSKVFEETKDELEDIKSDGYDSDGYWEEPTIVQEPEQMENTQEPVIAVPSKPTATEPQEVKTPTLTTHIPVLGDTKFVRGREQMEETREQMEETREQMIETSNKSMVAEAQETSTPRSFSPVLDNVKFVQEPEQMETTQEKLIAESPVQAERTILHESELETAQEPVQKFPTKHTTVEREIVQEPEQFETPREPMVQIPAKPLIMEVCENRTPSPPRNLIPDDNKHLEIETAPAAKQHTSSSSPSPRISPPAREPRGDLPDDYNSRPSRREMEKKKRRKSIEVGNGPDLLPAPIQEALRNTIVEPRARDISSSPISSPTAEPAKRATSRSRPPSRPGTPGLTMLQEESEEEHALDVDNRDSAFVSDSPIPLQGSFSDEHERVRDSGIHLRDNSPSMRVRAPVSSADAAIESMAWPSIDEDAGTIDLKQPQRPKVVDNTKHHNHEIDYLPSQRHKEEKHADLHRTSAIHGGHSPLEEKHKLTRKTSLSRGEVAEANHVDFVRSQRLKAFQTKSKEKLSEPHHAEPINKAVTPEREHTRHRIHRSEMPDLQYRKPKENKYGDLEPFKTPKTPRTEQRSVSENPLIGSAALAAAGLGFAAARKSSQESRPLSAQSHKSQRSASNISVTRLRTPIPLDAPQSPDGASTNRSFTPPLRRATRKISGDLRSLRQQSNTDFAKEIGPASVDTATSTTSTNTANPIANEGRARAQDMADVYDGYGEGRMGSPRSPTRPHSMRRRQSMQVLELESRLDQLAAENRALAESKAHAEHMLRSSQGAPAALVERDAQIDLLKRTLSSMQDEVKRLTEVNAGLSSAAVTLGQQHNARYGTLESQHAQTSRELQQAREAHQNLQNDVQGVIHNAIQERDEEIASLRSQLDAAKEQIRAMQREILAAKAGDAQFLIIRDEDYFDNACQQLCQHVQQWVLRFSKFSDMRACRLTSEINNDKTIDRLDNAILDGSDVDSYLADRVRRRDVFMSMTMTMVWEFIFTRYLFGMDREQRQKLKSLEKVLSEVGPPSAVHQWRATTLTLLSKRESFARQKEQDTLAVVHAVLETLTEILPPPSHLEGQIEEQLKRVMKAAVDLSIEMRTQRAEYMMLPPLQPEYDANGDLASKVSFNSALMNERSGDTISNEELEAQKAVVRVVLFPLVVKKGDDLGQGDEEIVVCPAQVLVAKPRMGKGPVGRVYSPASGVDMDRKSDRSRTPASMQSSMPDTNVI